MKMTFAALLLAVSCALAWAAPAPAPAPAMAPAAVQAPAGLASQNLSGPTPVTCALSLDSVRLPIPLEKVHAHNDYEHVHPLYDALAAGICSIEADPWLVNGIQYVAHDANLIQTTRTLENLYIQPLSQIINKNYGYVYPASKYLGVCTSVILLIDFKGAAYFAPNGTGIANTTDVGKEQFDNFELLLEKYQAMYPGMFTQWFTNGSMIPGALNIYISGSRPPPAYVKAKPSRLAALDGRLIDLNNAYGPDVYPLISYGFCCGNGTILSELPYSRYEHANESITPVPDTLTPTQYNYVRGLVELAHSQDRIIRYWATPDTPKFWQLGFDIGEDLVNTDDLEGIRKFVLQEIAAGVTVTQTITY